MIENTRQDWSVGATVHVGFLRGFVVRAVVPTPGDYAPDAYLLERGRKLYRFVPHKGLELLDTPAELPTPQEVRARAVLARAIERARS